MRAALTIGDFARITHLSVKTLRRYHEAGLLEPADVDPHTGYRYYSSAQVPTAQVIHRFRGLGMPVREVARVLATADPDERSAVIAAHLDRLEAQLDETRAAVRSLRRLLQPQPAAIAVEHRVVPARTVAAISDTVGLDSVLDWFGAATDELDAALLHAGRPAAGPRGGLYDNELFTHGRGRAVVYVPVAEPPARGRVAPFTIAAAELAITVHTGPHDDIDVTYGALGTHVVEHSLAVAGPVHEIYLVGPRDTADPARWRTEIGWPVFIAARP